MAAAEVMTTSVATAFWQAAISTTLSANEKRYNSIIYAINLAQLFMGLVISLLNLAVIGSIVVNQKLRTSSFVFLGNIMLANLIAGVMLSVSNVVDRNSDVVILKTEGSLVTMNSMVTIASLLALITTKLLSIRSLNSSTISQISSGSCMKIIVAIGFDCWMAMLFLSFTKAVVIAADGLGYPTCKQCYLAFEVAMLVIAAFATTCVFCGAMYAVCSHRKQASRAQQQLSADYKREHSTLLLSGLVLVVFLFFWMLFILMEIAWLATPNAVEHNPQRPDEMIATLFFLHCLLAPILCCVCDAELRATVKRILCCQRPAGDGVVPAPVTAATEFNHNHNSARSNHSIGRVPNNQLPPLYHRDASTVFDNNQQQSQQNMTHANSTAPTYETLQLESPQTDNNATLQQDAIK